MLMKSKKVKRITSSDFNSIYKQSVVKKSADWKTLFNGEIKSFDTYSPSGSFWYIGDFKKTTVVAAGGDIELCSPMKRADWIGIHPNEIGAFFHPMDVNKMQSFTFFCASYLAQKKAVQRNKIKISMIFRMMDNHKNYTWRLMEYLKIVYENKNPAYIMCKISNMSHLFDKQFCSMFILDRTTNENTMYYCDNEKIELKLINNQNDLTVREKEVLQLIAKGHISKEIGSILNISKNTVENHKQSIYRKTGIQKITELVAYANTVISAN